MNRKKILGIIFVIAALVCLHGFSTAMSREDGHTTKTMEQIEKAVFLQNGKVDKDNEGKPVIVRGKLHTAKDAHDTQLDLTFASAYVERRMETLGDNGKWTEEEDGSAAYFGKATLGEFKLSKDFLKDIKLTKGYTEFRNSELGDLTVKGKYVYESDTKRYQYSYIPDRKELTLVGTQNGKTLEEIRGIECVREGSLSKADLKSDEHELNMPYLIGSAVLSALFIVLACWMLGLFSKRKKEEEPSVIEEAWPEEELGEELGPDPIDQWLDEEINEAEMMELEETDAEEYGTEPAESPQNIKLLDDLEALRAELEGRREEFQEDASDEVNETEADTEAEMLSVLQNNWAIKQQKRKTAQTSSLHQRSRKKPQKKDGKAGKSGKKKQVRRRR